MESHGDVYRVRAGPHRTVTKVRDLAGAWRTIGNSYTKRREPWCTFIFCSSWRGWRCRDTHACSRKIADAPPSLTQLRIVVSRTPARSARWMWSTSSSAAAAHRGPSRIPELFGSIFPGSSAPRTDRRRSSYRSARKYAYCHEGLSVPATQHPTRASAL